MKLLATFLFQDVGDKLNNIIDPWMVNALNNMQSIADRVAGIYVDDAKTLCAIMMLFYISMQAYTLMTGDGKVSLIPLLRPFLFFIIVVNFTAFTNVLTYPLYSLDLQVKRAALDTRENVNQKFEERARLKEQLIRYLFDETEEVQQAASVFQNVQDAVGGAVDGILNPIDTLTEKLAFAASLIQLRLQTALFHFIEIVIFMVFKAVVYLLYFIRVFLLSILKLIGPIVFALSVTGVYRDLWVQWVSKFVSVSLYGAFAHFAIVLAFTVIIFGLNLDISSTTQLIDAYNADPTDGPAILLKSFTEGQAGGTALVVSAVVGIFGLLMVPLISTWVLGANSTTQVASKAVTGVYNTATKAISKG